MAGWEDYDFVRGADGEPVTLTGKQLFGLTYTAPVRRDIKGTVIYGDHVTLDTGTGAVHTAPGHGQDDYLVALEFDIPMLMPVDDNGVFTGEAGQFAGLSTDEANPVIIDWLREQGTLVAEKKINHSYPHCWRCHEPVIFRATDQWFVSMDKNALREDALRAINSEVEWIPAWAKNRIGAMVADRPDWCISRQRSWGVPIPVFKCAKCGNTVATAETFDAVIELFNTKQPTPGSPEAPSDYLPRGTKCEVCGGTELIPEKDILDVWWESGVSHTSVCRHRAEADGLTFPADMYLEGSDSTAAGSSRRCSPPSAPTACRRTGRSCTAGSPWTKKVARCRSRSATASIRRRCATSSAPMCCASGCPPAITPRTCPSPRTS